MVVQLRKFAYGIGLLQSHRITAPVIVVGNITVGGTGKTPLVIALVQHLKQQGWRPGVISRGYGGTSSFWPRIITQGDSAGEVGDESLLIYQRTGVPVVAGPERVRSAHMLVEKFHCNVLISDDGFQHYALQRDIDIVVIDGKRGAGNGWCLPSGPLREPVSGLRRADLQVINGQSASAASSDHREREFAMQMVVGDLYQLENHDIRLPLSTMTAKRVHAVAGLGNPERFFNTLTHGGLDIERHVFDDHHHYQASNFSFATDRDTVVMTEKDAVKCAGLLPPGVAWVLPVNAELTPLFYQSIDSQLANFVAEKK